MATLKERQAMYDEVTARHLERVAAVAAVLDPPTLDHISTKADAHGANYLAGLLEAGADPEQAKVAALEEASRHEEHLKAVHLNHAAPGAVVVDLDCAQCGHSTQHVVVEDAHGELVATCKCGRFKKAAAGGGFDVQDGGQG